MKNLATLVLILSFTYTANAKTWGQFKTQFDNSPYTKSWKLSKTLNEFKKKAGKDKSQLLNIPENPRPIRLAKATIRVFKYQNMKNPDGTNSVIRSTLCERVTYIKVYDFQNKSDNEQGYFARELALKCQDGEYSEDEGFRFWPVNIFSSVSLEKKPDDKSVEDIITKPIKLNLSMMFVGDFFDNRELKSPRFASAFTATTDLNSVSAIQVLNPEVEVHCSSSSEPNPDSDKKLEDSDTNKNCKIKDFDIYYTAIMHIEDDQQ